MIRKLFLMLAVTVSSLLGLTACSGDSAPAPTVTVTATATVTAETVPSATETEGVSDNSVSDTYKQRLAWGNSLERGALIKQISDASDEIYRAALLAQTEYDDTAGIEWTDASGDVFYCSSRFWRPSSSEWTYVVDVCKDSDEQINSYASRTFLFDSVQIIGGEHDNSTSVSNPDFYDVAYAYISLGTNSSCYSEVCGDIRGEVSTVEENRLIETEAARLLTQAAQELPQG